jgi:CcmD family protein
MNTMNYLFAANAVIWIVLALFLLRLHARERKLGEEIARLRRLIDKT